MDCQSLLRTEQMMLLPTPLLAFYNHLMLFWSFCPLIKKIEIIGDVRVGTELRICVG